MKRKNLLRKTIGLLLSLSLLCSSAYTVMANDYIKVTIDGQQIAFDVTPQLINNRTMVPLRAIFEALNATVDWNNETQTVTSTKDDTTIQLTINNPTMYVNGTPITLDSPACLINDRTLVPVRAISEAFKTNVDWDGNNSIVKITTNSVEPKEIVTESITLEQTSITLIVEDTKQLSYSIYPQNSINKDVKWESSNTSVVTVSNGMLTALKEGNATITVSTDNGKTSTCEITVNPKPIEWYSSSMYRVGSDIPAGDYYAVPTKDGYGGYYCKYTDSTQDDIEDNDNFKNFTFFRCYDGQYLKLSRCKITPIENAPNYSSTDGTYGEGTYRVGIDIPAGEYKFTSNESKYSGYYCVYTDITYDDIEDNDNFDDVAYYTISDGQYLKISRATAQKIGNAASTNKNTSSSSSNTTSRSGYGQVKGEITWKYNKVLGTRGDDGSYVILIPDDSSTKDYDNEYAAMFLTGTYDSGIIVTKCDGYGRFDFGDKVPAGKYRCAVISHNTTSSYRFNDEDGWNEDIDDKFGKYFSEEDLDTLKLFIGYQSVATSMIEVEKGKCNTITKDFGYTYI